MFDMKWIRDNSDKFDGGLKRRGLDALSKSLIELDDKRREHIQKLQQAQTDRNNFSKEIGKAKSSGDEERFQELVQQVSKLKKFIQDGEEIERELEEKLKVKLLEIPNIPFEEVPVGESEDDNVFSHEHGEKPKFDFEPKHHYELGEDLGLMDFETAASISGSRFVILKGALARLERALISFMLDIHTEVNGYCELNPPLLVNTDAMYGTSQLPKFEEDQFETKDGKWLIPTAEVPLTNYVREKILDASALPIRLTAGTYCFRLEAGSAGKDTRGMFRQHQFSKVELVSITKQDESLAELERMTKAAEMILQKLGLHYKVVTLCSGDMGFSAHKTYDIEVWLPGQNNYREISSCSVCGEFQARRMNARYRDDDGNLHYAHTLNGSGIAIGRTVIAILENYQNQDGTITIPEILHPYMNNLEKIS